MIAEPSLDQIRRIFETSHTIAVVGLSPNPDRPSHDVARYLQSRIRPHPFRIIPVNPNIEMVLGEKVYATVADIPPEIKIDVVDIFRRPEFVPAIMEQAISRGGISVVWMQDGVIHEDAATQGRAAGMTVIMDRCMLRDHRFLFGMESTG